MTKEQMIRLLARIAVTIAATWGALDIFMRMFGGETIGYLIAVVVVLILVFLRLRVFE